MIIVAFVIGVVGGMFVGHGMCMAEARLKGSNTDILFGMLLIGVGVGFLWGA